MIEIKPCTKLPYNAKSVTQVYEDFKNMIHKGAIRNTKATQYKVSKEESLSIAHEAFLMALGSFYPSCVLKGNTREGFGIFLTSTIKYVMQSERTQFVKRISRVTPESFMSKSVADDLFNTDVAVNSDYGQQAHADTVRLTLEQVLDHTYEWTDKEDSVIRVMYGLDTGEYATLRATGELVGMSHEAVSQKHKSALEKIRFALHRDLRQFKRK